MQEHPDTVGGAMLSGMREALRALRLLKGDSDEVGATAAAAVDTSHRPETSAGDTYSRV